MKYISRYIIILY